MAKLVLFGVSYHNPMTQEERQKSAADGEAEKVFHSVPSLERWAGLGTKEEQIAPGCFEANREALWRPIQNPANWGAPSVFLRVEV